MKTHACRQSYSPFYRQLLSQVVLVLVPLIFSMTAQAQTQPLAVIYRLQTATTQCSATLLKDTQGACLLFTNAHCFDPGIASTALTAQASEGQLISVNAPNYTKTPIGGSFPVRVDRLSRNVDLALLRIPNLAICQSLIPVLGATSFAQEVNKRGGVQLFDAFGFAMGRFLHALSSTYGSIQNIVIAPADLLTQSIGNLELDHGMSGGLGVHRLDSGTSIFTPTPAQLAASILGLNTQMETNKGRSYFIPLSSLQAFRQIPADRLAQIEQQFQSVRGRSSLAAPAGNNTQGGSGNNTQGGGGNNTQGGGGNNTQGGGGTQIRSTTANSLQKQLCAKFAWQATCEADEGVYAPECGGRALLAVDAYQIDGTDDYFSLVPQRRGNAQFVCADQNGIAPETIRKDLAHRLRGAESSANVFSRGFLHLEGQTKGSEPLAVTPPTAAIVSFERSRITFDIDETGLFQPAFLRTEIQHLRRQSLVLSLPSDLRGPTFNARLGNESVECVNTGYLRLTCANANLYFAVSRPSTRERHVRIVMAHKKLVQGQSAIFVQTSDTQRGDKRW